MENILVIIIVGLAVFFIFFECTQNGLFQAQLSTGAFEHFLLEAPASDETDNFHFLTLSNTMTPCLGLHIILLQMRMV